MHPGPFAPIASSRTAYASSSRAERVQRPAASRSRSASRRGSSGSSSAAARPSRLTRRVRVLALSRADPGGGEPRRGLLVASSAEVSSELGAVAGGLLEVVAEDLVELDEIRARALEPGREALVQLGRARLRAGDVVRGVADQQVPEPERVVAGQGRRLLGRTSSLRTSAEQMRDGRRDRRRERGDTRSRWNTCPSTEPRSSAARSDAGKLVEARREQRLDRRAAPSPAPATPRPSRASARRRAGFPRRTERDPLAKRPGRGRGRRGASSISSSVSVPRAARAAAAWR